MEDDPVRRVRARIANACDSCKARKVKCDGNIPCSYCTRRQRASTCHYSPQHRRRTQVARTTVTPSPSAPGSDRLTRHHQSPGPRSSYSRQQSHTATPTPRVDTSQEAADDETEVPREARLLRDAQGKLIFIGDCAPLSFFQTVRQLVSSRVDANAFAQHVNRFSGSDSANSKPSHCQGSGTLPVLHRDTIPTAVAAYSSVTSGIVDLFCHTRVRDDIALWASQTERHDVSSAVHFLVLAIGYQATHEDLAVTYFDHARNIALANLTGNLTVSTIQAFVLITVFMLGIAVRAAYSIGVHRTEINARFGPETQRQRDRLWKSMRILDLFLSTSMGRPPATSDVDCTVSYSAPDEDGQEAFDILNSSVQIFLIAEEIVVEVYSRKKISYQLTEGISRRLRDWSIRWLPKLKHVIASPPAEGNGTEVTGACQVLCSYYYSLEHFAKHDTNAGQYALIAKSLLSSALEYLEKKELNERIQRTESSSQLFGLVPREGQEALPQQSYSQSVSDRRNSPARNSGASGYLGLGTPPFGDIDTGFLGMSDSLPQTPNLSAFLEGRMDTGGEPGFGDLNLFQLLDGEGHIDLGSFM
ncbi:hypothetical protein VD0004_g9268 [Verticillium dahliae]|nr:hypothetical protein VD0004_g9268 [Verticillium dahliae]